MSTKNLMAYLAEKDKAVLASLETVVIEGLTPTQATATTDFLDQIDKTFSDPSLQLENRVGKFNEMMFKYGVSYNPLGVEKNKAITGCADCRTMTGLIIKVCENYGCVTKEFVTSVQSDSCNTLMYDVISKIEDDLDLRISIDQDVSGTTADNSCGTAPMRTVVTFSRISKKAICQCSGLDKMALLIERLATKLAKAFDKAVLYGQFNVATSAYVAIPNFDSIDLLIPAAQKLTATGISDTFKKITNAIVAIQDYTGCDDNNIVILMRQGVKTRMLNWLDSNDRPAWSELSAMGINCDSMKIACQDTVICQSVNQAVVAGNTVTDIWVGYRPYYVFGTYEYPSIEMMVDPLSVANFKLARITDYAGKLIDPKGFYKITATLI